MPDFKNKKVDNYQLSWGSQFINKLEKLYYKIFGIIKNF